MLSNGLDVVSGGVVTGASLIKGFLSSKQEVRHNKRAVKSRYTRFIIAGFRFVAL
jgi:hypothetical protein